MGRQDHSFGPTCVRYVGVADKYHYQDGAHRSRAISTEDGVNMSAARSRFQPMAHKDDVLIVLGEVACVDDRLRVNGTPWFNPSDAQWYYPVQAIDDPSACGEVTDQDFRDSNVVREGGDL